MTNSIYKPPAANVAVVEPLPVAFTNGSLSSGKLRIAACVSLLYLIILFPLTWLSILEGMDPADDRFQMWTKGLTLLGSAMWIYLLLVVKTLLNQRLEFSGANIYIHILVVLNIVMSVITLFLETGESLLTPLSMVFFAIMIPTGVVTVLFGRRLLSVARRYRYLPVYAWAEIISGICIASIFLFMLVLPLNVISTLALTLIFLTAAQELRSAG